MLTVVGCMFFGIGIGFCIRKVKIDWINKAITLIIWLLLFLLGLEMGGDENIVSSLPTLGLRSLGIAVAAVVGSCIAAAVLAKWIGMRWNEGRSGGDGSERDGSYSILGALKGSFIILVFFALGVVLGYVNLLGRWTFLKDLSFITLCVLILCVGISIGHNKNVFSDIRSFDKRILLLPIGTVLGTLAVLSIWGLFTPYRLSEVLAIGSGQAYYSLSSIMIAESKGVELGTIALLTNVMREIIALVSAPFLPRILGPLSPIAAGGATTADTTLPVIRQVCGDKLSMVSVYHGFVVDFSVPFMVALFCAI